ncbi:MAG TPA: NADH-quinone oxidoreductase subunit C [Acidimicrobiia bacterium]
MSEPGDAGVERAVEPIVDRVLPDNDVLHDLLEQFDDVGWEVSRGQDLVHVPNHGWLDFARAAHDAGFEMCVDVTVVDWMRSRPERFEIVANLLSMQHKLRLRITTTAPREQPTVASLVPIWPGVNFAEREAYDMFGVTFEGHPDLTRILMPDEWEGHPLRKDFGVGSVPVQFKESHQVN